MAESNRNGAHVIFSSANCFFSGSLKGRREGEIVNLKRDKAKLSTDSAKKLSHTRIEADGERRDKRLICTITGQLEIMHFELSRDKRMELMPDSWTVIAQQFVRFSIFSCTFGSRLPINYSLALTSVCYFGSDVSPLGIPSKFAVYFE